MREREQYNRKLLLTRLTGLLPFDCSNVPVRFSALSIAIIKKKRTSVLKVEGTDSPIAIYPTSEESLFS